ncbi:ABC transporter substrate-binding protein [Patulibacter sp. S7RM1-6]
MPHRTPPRRSRRATALVALTVAATALVPAAADAAKTPKRIVALSPFTANTLAALNVKPVAVGAPIGGSYKLSSKLKGVPRLTLSHPKGANLEDLITLKPDLVLSSPNWRQGTKDIEARKITVIDGWDPQSLKTVVPDTEKIAKRVGKVAQGKKLVKKIRQGVKKAKAGIKKHPKVLVVLGVGTSTTAFMPDTWGGAIVKEAGGDLLTSGLNAQSLAGTSGGFAPLSDEEVVARNPDVIVAVPHGAPSSIAQTKKNLANRPGWKNTKAARSGRVYVSDPDTLLQASTDPGAVIRKIRREYLKN